MRSNNTLKLTTQISEAPNRLRKLPREAFARGCHARCATSSCLALPVCSPTMRTSTSRPKCRSSLTRQGRATALGAPKPFPLHAYSMATSLTCTRCFMVSFRARSQLEWKTLTRTVKRAKRRCHRRRRRQPSRTSATPHDLMHRLVQFLLSFTRSSRMGSK